MTAILSQGPIFLACLAVMLGVVVIIHELGHYLAGRLFGAAVESFSVGFGKPIFEVKDSRNTRWRVNWIPLGGFVKFVGESQLPSDVGKIEAGPVGKAYGEIGVGARSIVALAGPVANFVLAAALYALILGFNGSYTSRIAIVDAAPDQPAARGGIVAGDILVDVEGKPIETVADIQLAVIMSSGETLDFTVERDGALVELVVTPERQMRENELGQVVPQGTIGVSMQPLRDATTRVDYNPVEAVGAGIVQTGDVLVLTTQMLGRILTGREPISLLSGPVAIGDAGRRIVNQTMENEQVPLADRLLVLLWRMIGICAAVSVGIGFFNLLPLPVLDGGHLVFNAYEAVTGRAMPEKVQEFALMAGLGLLLTMFVFITWGDILETGLFNRAAG
ncbi:MAG: M50 family metallopeptidase [Pseudomonadota bacterium]